VGSVGAPWLAFIAAATWRSLRSNPGSLPRPAIYAGSAVVFGLLGIVTTERTRPLVGVFAWSLVLASLIKGDLLAVGGQASYLAPGTGSNSASAQAQIKANTQAAVKQGKSSPTGQTRGAGGEKAQPGAH
jgi:hypothetical protein